MGTTNAKFEAFQKALKEVNNIKKGILSSENGSLIATLSDRPMNVEIISSGSVVLDNILGGGFAKGRIVEIYGPEAGGKSSIALTAAGNVQRSGGTVAFIDLENALDPKYAKKLGVDIDKLAVSQPDCAEQALELVQYLAETGVVDLIVVDSVASLVPKAELEGDMEQQTMAVVARLMSRALRKLVGTANRTKTTVIFINQIREKVGLVFGDPTTTPGGKALKFYASQRIKIAKTGKVTDSGKEIGTSIKMTIVKNKVAPPFGVGESVLTFNKGINRAAELVEVGPKIGAITMPNNRTYIDPTTGEIFAKSKAEALNALETDSELFESIATGTAEAIRKNLFDEDDGESADNDIEAETTEDNEVT